MPDPNKLERLLNRQDQKLDKKFSEMMDAITQGMDGIVKQIRQENKLEHEKTKKELRGEFVKELHLTENRIRKELKESLSEFTTNPTRKQHSALEKRVTRHEDVVFK